MSTRYRLAPHQEYAEMMMEDNPALGIFYEAGTGKTMIALSRAYHALENGEIESVLIVCPASLVGNWQSSMDKMLDFEGYTEEGVQRLKDSSLVVSYQRTYHSERIKDRRVICLRPEVDRRWGMMIVDEAHGLGGHNSAQTKACLALAQLSAYRYALTGTPVSGGGGRPDYQKLYGIIQFLHPGTWKGWTEFSRRYVTSVDKWFKPQSYDVEACEKLMKDNAILARLRDCYGMPGETHTILECELAEKQVYKDLSKWNVEKYGITLRTAGQVYPKLFQLCSGHLITDDGVRTYKTSKDEALRTVLEGTEDSVVIFCNYTASVDRCAEIAHRCGRKVIRYDGRSKADDWMLFQRGDADCIVCQYQKGGVGLDLYKSATTVYFEPCWSVLQLEQSKARTMRKGQTRSCRFLYLVTPNTREADAWEAVRRGMDLTSDLFERWAREEGQAR